MIYENTITPKFKEKNLHVGGGPYHPQLRWSLELLSLSLFFLEEGEG